MKFLKTLIDLTLLELTKWESKDKIKHRITKGRTPFVKPTFLPRVRIRKK